MALSLPGLLTWVWSRPAPAAPLEMPPLVLDARAVAAQIAADAAAAQRAPDDDERSRLYREANVAEHDGREPPERARRRSAALVERLRAYAEAHGEDAVEGLRARDLARAEAALRGELPAGDRVSELGGFPRMMERYGLARGGRQVAPRFVVRTVFKARWNALHGRELTQGLSRVEQLAYWGWLATRGEGAPVERRLAAVEQYASAGGAHAAEIRAVLLYGDGRLEEARQAFERAYATNPTFRLRNHALACAEP